MTPTAPLEVSSRVYDAFIGFSPGAKKPINACELCGITRSAAHRHVLLLSYLVCDLYLPPV